MRGGSGGHRVRVAEPDARGDVKHADGGAGGQHDGTRRRRHHVRSGVNAAAEYAAASPGRHNADACTDDSDTDACTDDSDSDADACTDPDVNAVAHAQHDGDGHVRPRR